MGREGKGWRRVAVINLLGLPVTLLAGASSAVAQDAASQPSRFFRLIGDLPRLGYLVEADGADEASNNFQVCKGPLMRVEIADLEPTEETCSEAPEGPLFAEFLATAGTTTLFGPNFASVGTIEYGPRYGFDSSTYVATISTDALPEGVITRPDETVNGQAYFSVPAGELGIIEGGEGTPSAVVLDWQNLTQLEGSAG